MFRKSDQTENTGNKALSLVALGTTMRGDIETQGDIRIDGCLEGSLNCKGIAVVGPQAKINGNIQSNNVEIWGEVNGDITAIGRLSLKSSAVISGNLVVGKLLTESGASLTGNCKMIEAEENKIGMGKNEVLLMPKPQFG